MPVVELIIYCKIIKIILIVLGLKVIEAISSNQNICIVIHDGIELPSAAYKEYETDVATFVSHDRFTSTDLVVLDGTWNVWTLLFVKYPWKYAEVDELKVISAFVVKLPE